MPKIIHITPSKSLSLFVSNYIFLEFDTQQEAQCWPCYTGPGMSLYFFLENLPLRIASICTDSLEKDSKNVWLKGLFTQFADSWSFKGSYSIFSIQFTPNGFYGLFKLPLHEFTDQIVDAEVVFGTKISLLCEKLRQTETILKMAQLADEFLEAYIIQYNYPTSKKEFILEFETLLKTNGSFAIKKYASLANMSLRNFERKFTKQVGTSPKLFCRLLRFYRAIELKMKAPKTSWTHIAIDCDYYDQMHLVRESITLSGRSPTHLFKHFSLPRIRIEKIERSN